MIIKKKKLSGTSSNIFFHILTKCNLKCKHCYINPSEHGNIQLDFSTIISWLEILYDNYRDNNVIFLGGEPTLHPNLSRILKIPKKLGYKSVTLDTNGFRIVDILKNISVEDVDLINFSLDGPTPKINDYIRGSGSFKNCTDAIFETKKKGFKIGLIFTVSLANIAYLKQMPVFLSYLGIDVFFIQVIGIRGDSKKTNEIKIRLRQVNHNLWFEIIPIVVKDLLNRGISVSYPKVFLKNEDFFECAALISKNYFIFPNGRVYLCPLCENFPIHSLEIKNGLLIETLGINEKKLFSLDIPEGCVMNKIIQPGNISYNNDGSIKYKIACCMLKETLLP